METIRRIFKKITAVTLSLIIMAAIVSSPVALIREANAASDSKVQTYEQKIEQLKKDQKLYEQQIKDAKANAASYLKQKEILDKQINAYSEQIEVSNALLIEYNNAIAGKEEAITTKQSELDTRFEHFKARMRTSYEEGVMGYLTMLFSSKSISGFLTSLERMTNMLNYDKRTMEQINEEKSALSEEKSVLESIKAAQQEIHETLKKSEEELEKKSKEAQDLYEATIRDQAAKEKMLAEAKAAQKKAEQDLDKLLKEIANKNNGVYSGGAFSWPLPQYENRITSKHGWRTYTIWGKVVTDYHRGIDISCPTGTPVYAGADGVVEVSGWNDSYGYYVVISHGSGYTTLYAHNSQLLVKQGQRVTRGQQISKSGSTGNSSGPHLHLEISIKGVLQNPLANGILSHPALVYYC